MTQRVLYLALTVIEHTPSKLLNAFDFIDALVGFAFVSVAMHIIISHCIGGASVIQLVAHRTTDHYHLSLNLGMCSL